MKNVILLLLFYCGVSTVTQAQTVPSDETYKVFEQGEYFYYFPKLYKDHIPKAVEFNEHLEAIYQKSYSWKLEERTSLVLASERNQIGNGFATAIPNIMTFFYPSGFSLLDSFASPNWYTVLLAHESAHLYQLDAKSEISSLVSMFLGHPLVVVTPFVPIFVHPNALAPTFMLEGNAVMNESTHDLGGRLFSGHIRAQVFQLLKSDKVNTDRLFNDHLEFPFGAEKYQVGGYFNAFLAQKYGIAKANQYFLEQGQRFINPLVVNHSFQNHFGKSYSLLLREFIAQSQTLWEQQKQIKNGQLLFTSLTYSKLNADSNRIWFLTQDDLKTPPEVTVVQKEKLNWTQVSKDLAAGKVFWIDESTPTTATSLQHSTFDYENSLYGEGLKFYPEYRSKIVQDMRAGKTAYIDGRSQFFSNDLYIDGVKVANVNSSVILNDSGDSIYFVQNENVRTLVRNGKNLTSFKGYYGYPLEETKDGAINFIAATEFGSGLFQWKDGQIYRLSDSDLIVDARQINDSMVLVVEVTDSDYKYQVISTSPFVATPAFYEYNLLAEEVDKTRSLNNEIQQPAPENHTEYRNFSGLKDLRYSSTNLSLALVSPGGVDGYIISQFVDPLFYHQLTVYYQRIFDSNTVGAQYLYNRHYIKPYIGYVYNEDRYSVLTNGSDDEDYALFYYDQRAYLGVQVNLLTWRRWSSVLNSSYAYEKEDLYSNRFRENFELTNNLQFSYAQSYGLAYAPYRYWNLSLSHQSIDSTKGTNRHDDVYIGQMSLSGDIGYQNYLGLQYTEGFSQQQNIELSYTSQLGQQAVDVYRLFADDTIAVKHIRSIEASYKRPFDTALYFTRFPLSLRRSAIYLEAGYYNVDSTAPIDNWFMDYQYGVELEGLLIHRAPIRFRLGGQATSENNLSGMIFQINSKQTF